jgi:hypothetical protein
MLDRRPVVLVGAVMAGVALAGWVVWVRSDAYQRRAAFERGAELVAKHPALPPAVIADWFGAAAVYDRKAAVKALQAIPTGSAREQSVSAMARSLLKAGHTIDALSVAGQISDTATLAVLLRDLAASLVSSPEKPAGDLASELKALADRERTPALASTVLSSLTGGLAALGANQAAASVARQFSDPAEQALALMSLSKRFNEGGNTADAASGRREALAAAQRITAPRQRLAILMQLLVDFYETGDLPLAKQALAQAGVAAAALPDPASRVEFLPVFARALERAGDVPAAQAAVTQAIAAAKSLPSPEQRAAAFARIVVLSRDPSQIDAVVRDVEALPPDLASAPTCAAARSLAALGQLGRARRLSRKCALPADELSVSAAILRSW